MNKRSYCVFISVDWCEYTSTFYSDTEVIYITVCMGVYMCVLEREKMSACVITAFINFHILSSIYFYKLSFPQADVSPVTWLEKWVGR